MSKTKTPSRSHRLGARRALAAGALATIGAALTAGCLDRPVQQQTPNTTNVFVDNIQATAIDKIDLLFVIDNSVSMGDKQKVLQAAVPNLLRRLIQPTCVDEAGNSTGDAAVGGECPDGSKPEFTAINDIHIGAITSSLGAHGGDPAVCGDAPPKNDRAHLIPTVRGQEGSAGFLTWTGAEDVDGLVGDFASTVTAAGESGCGYEATLESWYRFLVDPAPAQDVVVQNVNGASVAVKQGVDETLIAQRDAFLRSDSLVAIIMLSDENDCSIQDGGSAWLTATGSSFQKASEACDENPNDKCCYSCFLPAPDGCSASPRCDESVVPREDDRANVRCFNQKQRFGIDFLYPTDRYVNALKQTTIIQDDGTQVPNPLFQARGDKGPRSPELVYLAGIVGVPWQDVATEASLSGAGLEYLTAADLNWDVILGNPKANPPVAPTDPLMVESIGARQGTNPVTGDALVGVDNVLGNPINGNEYDNEVPYTGQGGDNLPLRDDLQYACIFPLAEPVVCDADSSAGCDCKTPDDLAKNKPLCQEAPGAAQGTTQYYAKAYPGTRFLEVLQGFGNNSIVASICPKNPDTSNPTDPNSGYNPAVGAIIDRLAEVLGGRCLPRELDVDPETGEVPCAVVEALPGLTCDKAGRAEVDPKVRDAVLRQLKDAQACGGEGQLPCDASYGMCEIIQLQGADREACLFDPNASAPGYCYIDPGKGPSAGGVASGEGNCTNEDASGCTSEFVEKCEPGQERQLRFVETAAVRTPTTGATTFVACVGSNQAQ